MLYAMRLFKLSQTLFRLSCLRVVARCSKVVFTFSLIDSLQYISDRERNRWGCTFKWDGIFYSESLWCHRNTLRLTCHTVLFFFLRSPGFRLPWAVRRCGCRSCTVPCVEPRFRGRAGGRRGSCSYLHHISAYPGY